MKKLLPLVAIAGVLLTGCGAQGAVENDIQWATKTMLLPSGREAECVVWTRTVGSSQGQLECFIVPEEMQLPTLPTD